MTPAVRYTRVSSPDQAKAYGPAAQNHDCQQNEERLGLTLVHAPFHDTFTGFSDSREALDALKAFVAANHIQAVSFPRVDRIARDFFANVPIVGELIKAGLRVYSADMGEINANNISSVTNYMMRAWQAHVGGIQLKDNMYKGSLAKGRSGIPVRPVYAYGYREGEVYEPEAVYVRRIFAELEHAGMITVARRLNAEGVPPPGLTNKRHRAGKLWRPSSLHVLLRNEAYKGVAGYGRSVKCPLCQTVRYYHNLSRPVPVCCGQPMVLQRVTPPCAAIVSEAQWERTNQAVRRRATFRQRGGKRVHIFELLGHVRCGVCRHAMGGQDDARPSYFCSKRRRRKVLGESCEHRTYHNAAALHAEVRNILRGWVRNPDLVREALGAPAPRVDAYAARRVALEGERERWKLAYGKGLWSLEEVAVEMEKIELQLAALPEPDPVPEPRRLGAEGLRCLIAERLDGPLHELLREAGAVVYVFPEGRLEVALE